MKRNFILSDGLKVRFLWRELDITHRIYGEVCVKNDTFNIKVLKKTNNITLFAGLFFGCYIGKDTILRQFREMNKFQYKNKSKWVTVR